LLVIDGESRAGGHDALAKMSHFTYSGKKDDD
jgi:hypothetical protein